MKKKLLAETGFSLTELMVVLVIIGILVLLALPRLLPVVNKAKATEAKLALKQLHMLQKSWKLEYDRYSSDIREIGFEQEKSVSEGGTSRYKVEIITADEKSFSARAVAVVDFDDDGVFNVWEVSEEGLIKETVPD